MSGIEMHQGMFQKHGGHCSVSRNKHAENNCRLPATTKMEIQQDNSERTWSVLVSTLVASLGSISLGYSVGYSSAAVTQLGKANQDIQLSQESISWFSSLLNIGAMLGGPLGGFLIDRIGRKFTFMITTAPFVAGWLLIVFGMNEWMLYAGRFACGLGTGLASMNVPVYISEMSSPRLRGAMGSINQLGISLGIVLAYVIGDALTWRQSAFTGVVTPVLLLVLMLCMPETARWLISHGKEDKSRKTLKWLRGPNWNIEKEIRDIKQGLANQETISIREFAKPKLLRPLLISLSLMFFQQFTGINAFTFYCATIFEKAGFKEGSTSISILTSTFQFITTLVVMLLVDRTGRRFFLLVSGVGMLLSCLTAGAYFYVTANQTDAPSWLAVTSVSVYTVGFSLGWGPCAWLMIGELFPAKACGRGCGFSVFFNWACSFVVTKTFPTLIDQFTEAGTFWFYGSMAFLSVAFAYFFLPETKGKSLEEIEAFFETKGSRLPAPVRETCV